MKTAIRPVCAKRSARPADDLEAWAQALVADPSRFGATDREAEIVQSLLTEAVS